MTRHLPTLRAACVALLTGVALAALYGLWLTRFNPWFWVTVSATGFAIGMEKRSPLGLLYGVLLVVWLPLLVTQ